MRPIFSLTLSVLMLGALTLAALPTSAAPSVDLGAAGSFAILAGTGITNTGHTTVTGDVGSYPTASQTGFDGPASSVTLVPPSTNHGGDGVTQLAKEDLMAAYVDARDRPDGTPVGQLAGLTRVAGVYMDDNDPDSMSNTGTLTLDGGGVTTGVWIFQSGSTLTFGPGSTVVLTNGAQACNVFWQVTSSATLDTMAHVEGTILALTSISLNHGASVNGRVLANNGAVTMDTNTIQNVPCTTGGGTSTTTATTPPTSTTGTDTESGTGTGPPTDTGTHTGTGTSAGTLTGTGTGTGTTPAIPFFPTTMAFAMGAVVATAGAVLILRRRRA